MKKLLIKIFFITSICLFLLAPIIIFAQEPCESKYPDDGTCKTECAAEESYDDTTGLCSSGKCCHTYGEAANINLQVPLFGYSQAQNIAEYIVTIYNASLYVVVPIIVVILIASGALWILAGGDKDLISKAKSRIISAFIGLGIVLFSYVILSFLGLTQITAPQVEFIKPIEVIPPEEYTAITGQPVKSKSEYYALGEQVAQEKGLHPCFMKAMLDMESGGRPNVVGHDENANNSAAKAGKVPARKYFLQSGKTFKGSLFTPISSAPYNSGQKNDDPACSDREDLCLDWRWSHGIGLSQFTISGTVASKGLGTWCKPGVPSRSSGGRCYTARELFDPKISLEKGADILKKYSPSNAYAAFKAYNGSDEYARVAKTKFDACCRERGGC